MRQVPTSRLGAGNLEHDSKWSLVAGRLPGDGSQVARVATVVAVAAALVLPTAANAGPRRPTVEVSRSALVVFEVHHAVQMVNAEQYGAAPLGGFQILATSTERYAALYFPAAKSGWVQVRNADTPKAPPLVAPIGRVNQEGFALTPHHKYSMIVALANPGRVSFPDANYRIVGVHTRGVIKATLSVQALPVPGGSGTAVTGFAPVDLTSDQASMVALSVDYQHSTDRVTSGAACVAPVPADVCSFDTTDSYRSSWGAPGSAGEDTVGRAFGSAGPGSYMTGDFEVVDGAPFQAARLIAFGLQVDQ